MSRYALAIRFLSEPRQAVKLALILVFSTMIAVNSRAWFATAQSLADRLPQDAQVTCFVDPQEFKTWFESGSVTVNGAVKPADGLAFPGRPNCNFYKRSWQMFLWLTSLTPPRYEGGGGLIFNSPVFYGVSTPDPNDDKRIFIPHTVSEGPITVSGVRVAQRGPNNLPVVLSKQRKILEVAPEKTAPGGKPLFKDRSGKEIEVYRATRGPNQMLLLFDKYGNLIRFPKQNAKLKAQFSANPIVQRFIVEDSPVPVFVDPFGNIIEIEVGQAGGDEVLMTKNTSPIYYTTAVNDVFAYFLTGTKNGGITPAPTRFPTTREELEKITKFASERGETLIDPNVLAVEIKASWVEAAELPDPSSYITIWAKIPMYKKSPTEWTLKDKTKTTQLALIGLHVVGSAKGHPEMIWATFEHFGNTPNAKYKYKIGVSGTKYWLEPAENWLFCGTFSGPFNFISRVRAVGNALRPINGYDTIGPSDIHRVNPWGVPRGNDSNNTDIISINNSVLGKLHDGDVRKNYKLIGATWIDCVKKDCKEVGTNRLANSTMETYQQGFNCFNCHSVSKSNMLGTLEGGGLSHIWGPLKPLF